jgi:hypothetical protein
MPDTASFELSYGSLCSRPEKIRVDTSPTGFRAIP